MQEPVLRGRSACPPPARSFLSSCRMPHNKRTPAVSYRDFLWEVSGKVLLLLLQRTVGCCRLPRDRSDFHRSRAPHSHREAIEGHHGEGARAVQRHRICGGCS